MEVPARVDADGLSPLAGAGLPRSAQALVVQVKEYERGIVEAAMTGDAGLAAVALAQHPLVPGITAARELIAEYRDGTAAPRLPAIAPAGDIGRRRRLPRPRSAGVRG